MGTGMVMGVLPRLRDGLSFLGQPWEEPGQLGHCSDCLNGFPHLPLRLCAPSCVWRRGFDGVMAPVMGLGGAEAGNYLGSPPGTTPLCSFVCMETSFLSEKLTPFTRLLSDNW